MEPTTYSFISPTPFLYHLLESRDIRLGDGEDFVCAE